MSKQGQIPIWWNVMIANYIQNGGNATEAYMLARPKVKIQTAEVEGCKLLRNPRFVELMEKKKAEMEVRVDMSKDAWFKEVMKVYRGAFKDTDKLRALDMVAKAFGYIHVDKDGGTVDFNTVYLAQVKAIQDVLASRKDPTERARRMIEEGIEIIDEEK